MSRSVVGRQRTSLVTLIQIAVVAGAYFVGAKVGLQLAFANKNVTAVWPPSGISLAALLLCGRRVWPGIAIGALVANLANGASLETSALITVGNTFAPLAASVLLERVVGIRLDLTRVRDVCSLVFVGGLAAMTVSATLGTAALVISGGLPASAYWSVWSTWWIGDAMGVVLLTPFLLVAASPQSVRFGRDRAVEASALFVILCGLAGFAFVNHTPLAFLVFPAVVWASVRFLQAGAASAVVVIAGVAIAATARGAGPYAESLSVTQSLFAVQAFNGAVALTALVLAAITIQATRARADLRGLAADLEERVVTRTVELRRSEAQGAERAHELERSNKELEQFAYMASHDLQEPLRMVTSYVQLLEMRYKGQLDGDATQFIAYAVDGTTRMQGLINDLLTYSRAGRGGRELKPISTDDALDQALHNLGPTIAESGGSVVRAPLPVVDGDPVQFTQLFQNLVSNAFKFHGGELPRVRISATPQNGDWSFMVSDNGIGVAPVDADRIFEMFQRLHPRTEYPGTGIGLPICKKIVESHGGRIWLEPQPGSGSTIHFTVPRRG